MDGSTGVRGTTCPDQASLFKGWSRVSAAFVPSFALFPRLPGKTSGAASFDTAPAPLERGADLPRHATPVALTFSVISALRSMADKLLEFVDLVAELRIAGNHAFDLADGVQHRRVIAIAEPAADLGQ